MTEVEVGFVAVGNAAAVTRETLPQGVEYEQGHNRHLDIWAGQRDETPKE